MEIKLLVFSEISRKCTNEPICRADLLCQVKNGLVGTGEEEEGGMNWETRIDMYLLHYVK